MAKYGFELTTKQIRSLTKTRQGEPILPELEERYRSFVDKAIARDQNEILKKIDTNTDLAEFLINRPEADYNTHPLNKDIGLRFDTVRQLENYLNKAEKGNRLDDNYLESLYDSNRDKIVKAFTEGKNFNYIDPQLQSEFLEVMENASYSDLETLFYSEEGGSSGDAWRLYSRAAEATGIGYAESAIKELMEKLGK
ncbi:MAG: hypothetical protein ACRC68_09190 [Clostridium sp.]